MPKIWSLAEPAFHAAILSEVIDLLVAGGVVAYPTDTLYGLAVHPWHREGVRRLFAAKGRAADQAIPLVAADLVQVDSHLGPLPTLADRLARGFWPGPLTLVIPAPSSLPAELLGEGGTVAVRVPAHAVARELARLLGVPITSTSANLSGMPATSDPAVVIATLGDRIDGVLDGGYAPGGAPSTIVDASGESPRLLRAGAVPWERVVQFLS